MKICRDKAILRIKVFEHRYPFQDEWSSDGINFFYPVKIELGFTLRGIKWHVDIPNYSTWDKNLFRAVADAIDYSEKKGIAYDRLSSKARKMSFWKWL